MFRFDKDLKLDEIVEALDSKKIKGFEFFAKASKYNRFEVFVEVSFDVDLEEEMKRILGDEFESFRMIEEKVIKKKVYCFVNCYFKTVEIYRGKDNITSEILNIIEKQLKVKLIPLTLSPKKLLKILRDYSVETKQLMFKNVDGFFYQIYRGRNLENNKLANWFLKRKLNCLKVISFKPKIRFLNGNSKYQVTFNAEKGTIKLSSNGFKWRPRYEVRQIVFILSYLNSTFQKV